MVAGKINKRTEKKREDSSEFCAVYVIPPIFYFTQSIGCSEIKKKMLRNQGFLASSHTSYDEEKGVFYASITYSPSSFVSIVASMSRLSSIFTMV